MEDDYAIINGQVSIALDNIIDSSAYQVIVTPSGELLPTRSTNYYPAEYKDAAGNVTFVVTAQNNGYYQIRLRCQSLPAKRTIRMLLNGAHLPDIPVPASTGQAAWADVDFSLFLTSGINCIALKTLAGDEPDRLKFELVDAAPVSGPVSSYEAGAPGNKLAGTAAVMEDPAASGGKYVGNIGNGAANFLQFHDVRVAESGIYRLVVYFANAEFRGGHSYNSQIVDRWAEISVNGQNAQKVYFRNTFSWNNYPTRVIDIKLEAGSNTIKFTNPAEGAYAPNIDRIEIAGPVIP